LRQPTVASRKNACARSRKNAAAPRKTALLPVKRLPLRPSRLPKPSSRKRPPWLPNRPRLLLRRPLPPLRRRSRPPSLLLRPLPLRLRPLRLLLPRPRPQRVLLRLRRHSAPRRFTPVVAPKRPEPPKKPAHAPRDKNTNDRRQAGKLTVTRALNEDEGARARSLAALKRAREKERRAHFAGQTQQREKQVRDVIVPEAITVQDLANRMAEKAADLIKALFKMGMMVTINQTIDQDTAELLVTEFGHNIQRVNESDVDIDSASDVDAETTLKARPPWLRSWATSTTARPACSTRCAAPTWCAAKRAASRSTSAPIRSRPRVVTTSPSSTRRATKPSPKCACAGRMSPTS
jgi:hypothetical protein